MRFKILEALIFLCCHVTSFLDIDECQFEPCDNQTSTCRNLFGSYACDCNYGYEKEDDFNSCVGNDDGFNVFVFFVFVFSRYFECLLYPNGM